MGRRLNLPTPTVINTELIPLTESFYIEADGQLEQWYYENDGRYAPNRKVTPMTLTPHISAFDKDTNQTYEPDFYIVHWYELAWDATQGDYVETEITNLVDSLSADYVKVDNSLLVKKNVGYTHAVTITCRAEYIDPRDSGITYDVSDDVLLTTNRDATVMSPELDVLCPSSQAFNPLTDNHIDNGNLVYDSEFTMKATSDYSSVLATNVAQYKVDALGTEEIVPQNDESVETCAPTMDIRYGDVEETDQTFMERQTSGGQATSITGNMAYVSKIKGNTVKLNQMVNNGNFANGTTGWDKTTQGGTSTWATSNNVLTVTVTGSASPNSYIKQAMTIVSSHKYYVSFNFENSTDNLPRISIGGVSINDRKNVIVATDNSSYVYFYYGKASSFEVGYTCSFSNIIILDLTAMDVDNLTTVEEVESWLATNVGLQDYYPYNAGELIPVKMAGIKTSGFNIWDEEMVLGSLNTTTGDSQSSNNQLCSKNYIPVLGNTDYYLYVSPGAAWACFYDKNKNTITDNLPEGNGSSANARNITKTVFKTPANCGYIRFYLTNTYGTTYNNNICINLSNPARNGTYEAHWEAEQYLPITELKGRVNGTGDLVTIFPDGLKRAGNVYDEIKVENGVVKAIKRVGAVDLGALTWDYYTSGTYPSFLSNSISINYRKGNVAITPKYLQYEGDTRVFSVSENNIFRIQANASLWIVEVRDDAYTNADTYKTAMNGVMLYYGLATPVEYIIENMPRGQFEWYGISNDTEVLAETLPWYKSGQHTDTLVVDAMYSEEIRVVLRSRVSAGSDRLYPSKVYRSIVWKIPDVDINAYSENGGAVRSNTVSMDFDTIMNIKGSTLDDVIKQDNIRLNWKLRKSNSSAESDFGWGMRRTISADDLRNTIGSSSSLASTLVLPYAYLLGALEKVVDSNEVVTDNGEEVYDRPVF